MTHSELVQAATELLAETADPCDWLGLFDHALASVSDQPLAELVALLRDEVEFSRERVAA